jgi:thiol-disulfide isomerase/thioredoxin
MADVQGEKATLVMILSNHCPFVKLLKPGIAKLVKEYQSKGVSAAGISASSIQTHPQDGPELMAKDAEQHGYTFPYLYDESQQVAQVRFAARFESDMQRQGLCTPAAVAIEPQGLHEQHGHLQIAMRPATVYCNQPSAIAQASCRAQAFRAMCTPEFYVFDGEGKLAYHGQFDDARPGKDSTPVTGKDLRAALDAVLQRNPAPKAPPSVGCSVKWHPGKQPAYAS